MLLSAAPIEFKKFQIVAGFVAIWLLAPLAGQSLPLTTIYSFNGSDGSSPEHELLQDTNGFLYGTTRKGGLYSQGTVFKISTNGGFSGLFSFTNGADGYGPGPGLALASNGFFYGTANGGNYYPAYGLDAGVIYRINSNGVFTNLHSLTFPAEGATPGPLVQSPNVRSFFGMTQAGGTNLNARDQYGNPIGCGLIFRIDTNGSFNRVFSFNGTNGAGPKGSLICGTDHHLYGMASGGIGFSGFNSGGYGTIFKMATNGSSFTNLVFFNGTNGASPDKNGLMQGKDGSLYGTTQAGGLNNYGTIFRITTNGVFTNLYSFSGADDGARPVGTLIQAGDNNLYGTTSVGGSNNLGTMFEISTNGVFSTLLSFDGTNGAYPLSGLLQAKDGNLYGATSGDGTNNQGTIFMVQPKLAPAIIHQPLNLTVASGDLATFNVGALGALPLRFQWKSNAVAMVGATNDTLQIFSATTNNAASYAVIITNLYGSITSSVATLTILASAPVITNQPLSQIVSNGSTVTFTVGASGSPSLRYQWQTNGVSLAGATNATLTFSPVKTNNAGNYTVVVTNLYGSATSSVAVLTVGSFPPTISAQPQGLSLGTDNPATFAIGVSGTAPLVYQWQRNGTNLVDGGNIAGTKSSRLNLSPTSTNDAGDYTVVVTNFYGSVTSSVAPLTIAFPFLIDLQPQNQTGANGQSADFTVSVNGKGPFGFQWRKNGLNLTEGGNIAGSTSSTLTVAAASLTDEGFYSVVITNAYGSLTSSVAVLTVALTGIDFITFAGDQTITLTGAKVIASDLIVDGAGHHVVLSGNANLQLFRVNAGVHLTLRNLTIADGSNNIAGGGIYNNGGIVSVSNCTFSNNVVAGGTNGSLAAGGAICNDNGGTLIVNGATFVNNRIFGGTGSTGSQGVGQFAPGAQGGPGGYAWGGAICNLNDGTVMLSNCTFYNNQASGGAGGTGGRGYNGYTYQYQCGSYPCGFSTCPIFCTGTVYGGPGGPGGQGGPSYGGSIYNVHGNFSAINATFANGSALGGAAGIAGQAGAFGTGNMGPGSAGSAFGGNLAHAVGGFALKNCIVANPMAGGNYWGGTISDSGHNLSSDVTVSFINSTSFTNTNPNLGSLADNGGTTLTVALLFASPAIRAGDSSGAPSTDQRGQSRKALQIDIGAFETAEIPSGLPSLLAGWPLPGSAAFRLTFTNIPGTSFSVWSSTNLLLQSNNWSFLGFAREIAPGQFQFNDPGSSNRPQEFYRVQSP